MAPPTPAQLAYMQARLHEDRTVLVYGLHSTFMVVGMISVALRFLSRFRIGAKLGKDDWLICVALACLIVHATSCMMTVQYGVGRHVPLVSNVKGIVKANLVEAASYSSNLMFTKLSILALYHRIFSLTRGWIPTLWIFASFVVALGITQPLVYIFHCLPIQFEWGTPTENIKCIDFSLAIMVLGIIHIITDWLLLFLPIPVVWGLQLGQRMKLSVCSLFAVGGAVCIISIIRVRKSHELDKIDPTWNFVPVQSLSTVEGSLSILAACTPTWRPLFRFVGRGFSAYFSNSGSRHGVGSLYHRSGEEKHAIRKLPLQHISSDESSAPSSFSKNASQHANLPNVTPPCTSPRSAHKSSWGHSKRSESMTSGDSVERMLQGRLNGAGMETNEDLELGTLPAVGTERRSNDARYSTDVEMTAAGITKPQSTFCRT